MRRNGGEEGTDGGSGKYDMGRVGVNPCIGCHPIPTRNTFTKATI